MHIFIFILGAIGLFSNLSPEEQAAELSQEAHELYSEAQYGAGIILLEKAYALDSSNVDYQVDAAMGYINVQEFNSAEAILKSLQYKNEANDRVYQMLGRLYKAQNNPEKAEDFFKKGLRFFPKSGRLQLELGALKYFQGEKEEALKCWIKGTQNDPWFSSNYYWLAKHYEETGEIIWAVIYGELFITLEKDTYRSKNMGLKLFNMYRDAFTYSADNADGADFLPYKPKEGELVVPFTKRYLQTMKMARKVTELGESDLGTFFGISDIRFDFIEYWHDQRLNEMYPFALFTFLEELYVLDFWDAYHVWLMLRWNEKEFKYWVKNHKQTYEDFLIWFSDTELYPDSESAIFQERQPKP